MCSWVLGMPCAPCALVQEACKGKKKKDPRGDKVGPPRVPTAFSRIPCSAHPPSSTGRTSASCLPRITGLTRLALGHQLKYPFHSQKLGEQEGALSVSCQRRAGPRQTRPYTPTPTSIPGKSL